MYTFRHWYIPAVIHMTPATRLALARVQVAEVIRRMVPYLHAASYHGAAAVMLNHAADVADQIAREQEEAIAEATLRAHDVSNRSE